MNKKILLTTIFINLIFITQVKSTRIHLPSFKKSIMIILTGEIRYARNLEYYSEDIQKSKKDPIDYLMARIKTANKGKIPLNNSQVRSELTNYIIRTLQSMILYSSQPIEDLYPDLKDMSNFLIDEAQILPASLKEICKSLIQYSDYLKTIKVHPNAPDDSKPIDQFVYLLEDRLEQTEDELDKIALIQDPEIDSLIEDTVGSFLFPKQTPKKQTSLEPEIMLFLKSDDDHKLKSTIL